MRPPFFGLTHQVVENRHLEVMSHSSSGATTVARRRGRVNVDHFPVALVFEEEALLVRDDLEIRGGVVRRGARLPVVVGQVVGLGMSFFSPLK